MVEEAVNGFVVEAGDTQQLAEKLLLLIESSDLRKQMGQTNRAMAREVYDVEVGAEKMRRVFEQLLS